MRILGPIPHPSYKITAYTIERYFYVEIEAGPMKQCYKLPQEQTKGMEGIQKWLDQDFLDRVQTLFEEMYKNHKASLDRNLKE